MDQIRRRVVEGETIRHKERNYHEEYNIPQNGDIKSNPFCSYVFLALMLSNPVFGRGGKTHADNIFTHLKALQKAGPPDVKKPLPWQKSNVLRWLNALAKAPQLCVVN